MNPRDYYEEKAKSIVKDLREEKGISYKDLALRLETVGVYMDVQVLINRINGGKYSFSFAMQVLAAMGVETLHIPKPKPSPRRVRTGESKQG